MLLSHLRLLMHHLVRTPPSPISIRKMHTTQAETPWRPAQGQVTFSSFPALFCSVLYCTMTRYFKLKFVCVDSWFWSRRFVKNSAHMHINIVTWFFFQADQSIRLWCPTATPLATLATQLTLRMLLLLVHLMLLCCLRMTSNKCWSSCSDAKTVTKVHYKSNYSFSSSLILFYERNWWA